MRYMGRKKGHQQGEKPSDRLPIIQYEMADDSSLLNRNNKQRIWQDIYCYV